MRRRIAAAAAVVTLAVAGGWFWRVADHPAAPRPVRVSPLTTFAGSETEPAWSPDGKAVAFAWTDAEGANKDIYVKQPGQEKVQRVTRDVAEDFNPEFSPDGRRIAFLRRSSHASAPQMVVIPAEGGAERVIAQIAPTSGYRGLAWWPDGKSVLARDHQDAGMGLVRVFLSDGRKVPFLAAPPGGNDYLPSLSADGRSVAFARAHANETSLCIVGADATGLRCFMTKTLTGHAWLPGQDGLLFTNRYGLWQVEARGRHAGHVSKVADGRFREIAGDQSGKKFAFSRILSDVNVWRMKRDGTATRFIASSGEDSEPAWSPDGTHVVVRSNRSGSYELYSYAADGSYERQLTHFGSHLGSPRWSPDGKLIAFDGVRPSAKPSVQHTNIFVVPAEGGPVRRLTDDSRHYLVPAWSRDGRWIYCQTISPARTVRVSIEDSRIEEFLVEPLFDIAESLDGKFLYYTGGRRGNGIYRRTVSGGPESLIPGTEVVSLYRYWSAATNGVYFVDGPPNATLRFWDSRTGQVRRIARIASGLVQGPRGMTVSPDGSTVLYAAEDLTASDIMLLVRD